MKITMGAVKVSPASHSSGIAYSPATVPVHLHHFHHLRFSSTFQKVICNKRGHHSEQFHSLQWSCDNISAKRSSCTCSFRERLTSKGSTNEGHLFQEKLKKSLFVPGRWTNGLIATNMLSYIGQMATQGELMWRGAKVNNLIDEGEVWRLVTSSFLHADIGHLMVNCFSLYSVGPSVENLYGPQRFFTIYFVSAVSSAALSYWLCEAPAVGASGAIFGLVGSAAMFSMKHRNNQGSGAQDLRHIAQVIALNMIVGLSAPGIDNWGHLGGLLGGAAVSWFIDPT